MLFAVRLKMTPCRAYGCVQLGKNQRRHGKAGESPHEEVGRQSKPHHCPEDVGGGARDQVQLGGWQEQKQRPSDLERAVSCTKITIVRA